MERQISKDKAIEAVNGVVAWLESEDVWENELDGYDRMDSCHAVLKKAKDDIEAIAAEEPPF